MADPEGVRGWDQIISFLWENGFLGKMRWNQKKSEPSHLYKCIYILNKKVKEISEIHGSTEHQSKQSFIFYLFVKIHFIGCKRCFL